MSAKFELLATPIFSRPY